MHSPNDDLSAMAHQQEQERQKWLEDQFGKSSSNSSNEDSNHFQVAQQAARMSMRLQSYYALQNESQPLPILAPTNGPLDRALRDLIQKYPQDCAGKEHMIQHLHAAKLTVTHSMFQRLPTWNQVVELYRPGPLVLSLETCATYRERLQGTRYATPAAIAGLWNSGTTALSQSILLNLQGFEDTNNNASVAEPTVLWGKHSPLYLKYQ